MKVKIYGASDDLIEVEGKISDDIYCLSSAEKQKKKTYLSYYMKTKEEIRTYNISVLIAGAVVFLSLIGFIVGFLVGTFIK